MKALLTIVALAAAPLANAQTTRAPNGNSIPASNSIPAPSVNGAVTPEGSPATPAGPVAAQPTSPAEITNQAVGTNGANDSGEAAILKELHGADLAEMQEGEIAKTKATSTKVKKYGQMLIKDHTEADKRVVAEAKRLNITLTDTLPASAQADVNQLQSAAADAFDRTFCDAEASGHAKVISDVESAQTTVSDKGVKKLLGKLLPKLQKHEKEAQKLSTGAMKAS